MIPSAASSPTRPVTWRWSAALLGATCSLPAALVALDNPSAGLALAFGALPAAAVGAQGPRLGRYAILVVGLCIGVAVPAGRRPRQGSATTELGSE